MPHNTGKSVWEIGTRRIFLLTALSRDKGLPGGKRRLGLEEETEDTIRIARVELDHEMRAVDGEYVSRPISPGTIIILIRFCAIVNPVYPLHKRPIRLVAGKS